MKNILILLTLSLVCAGAAFFVTAQFLVRRNLEIWNQREQLSEAPPVSSDALQASIAEANRPIIGYQRRLDIMFSVGGAGLAIGFIGGLLIIRRRDASKKAKVL